MDVSALIEYFQQNLGKGYAETVLKQQALSSGWPLDLVDHALQEAKFFKGMQERGEVKKSHKILIVSILVIIIIGLILLSVSYLYLPNPGEKTNVAKPTGYAAGQAVSEQHLEYIFNELGAYELQDGIG